MADHYYAPNYPSENPVPPFLPIWNYLDLIIYAIFLSLKAATPGEDLKWCVMSSGNPKNYIILGPETTEYTYEETTSPPFYNKVELKRRENVAKGIWSMASSGAKLQSLIVEKAQFSIKLPHMGSGGAIPGPVIINRGEQLPGTDWITFSEE